MSTTNEITPPVPSFLVNEDSLFKPTSASTPNKEPLTVLPQSRVDNLQTNFLASAKPSKLSESHPSGAQYFPSPITTASGTVTAKHVGPSTTDGTLPPLVGPSVSTVLIQEDATGLDVTNYTGPYKQLWHLLLGKTDIVSNDVVHAELISRCNTIISGLMFYDKPVGFEIPKLDQTATMKKKVNVAIMKTSSVQSSVAMELLCLYFVYEYTGIVISLSKLLPTESAIQSLADDINEFYKRERLCVLYCAQVILNSATDSNHRFSSIFASFIVSASMSSWCKWLCLSLDKIENEDEHIQILHTLALLLYHYGHFESVATKFVTEFKFGKRSLSNKSRLYAEAVLIYSFLQSGKPSEDEEIERFMLKHVKQLDENPYFFGAVVSAFATRGAHNEKIRTVIQHVPHPEKCALHMSVLLSEYQAQSYRNKHGLGSLILKCVYSAAETILAHYERESFGSPDDWNQLLNILLRDEEIAHNFMCEHPEELTLLYTEALMQFPAKIEWVLTFWGAICRTATPDVSSNSILSRLTEVNSVAMEVKEREMHLIRPNGNKEWVLLGDIDVAGILVKSGTGGVTVRDEPIIISWELDTPAKEVTVWQVLMEVVIKKAYSEHPNFKEKTIKRVCSIAQFIVEFSDTSKEIPETMFNLIKPVTVILRRLLYSINEPQKKSKYIVLLLQVVKAGAIFDVEFLLQAEEPALWPTPEVSNYVTDIILAYESVLNSDYSVTKTFLRNIIDLFHYGEDDPYGLRTALYAVSLHLDNPKTFCLTNLRTIFAHAVNFVLENIYPSFVRWRMSRPSDQFEIIRDTFRVFCNLFEFKDPWFNQLKDKCCKGILAPGNSLLAVLTIDGEKLQDTWIRSSKENQYLDQTMYYALYLMVYMADFDIRTLQMLDSASNLTLVKKLGKLVRHRLNPALPTLAMNLLRKIALELNISLLACFGNGIDSFRDLLLQRLDFKSEAIKLKVAVLDFLTVCAQTQPGLIQHFFQDESFTTCILELLDEPETTLPIASLALVRALFRKGNSVFKNHTADIWIDIIKPIKSLDKFTSILSKQKVISYTMNIFSVELYRSTVIEKEFSTALTQMLNSASLLENLMLSTSSKTPYSKKCIYSIKYFLTLVLSRPDHEMHFEDDVRELCLNSVAEEFWTYLEQDEYKDMIPPLVELMLILGPSNDTGFLEKLANGFPLYFKTATLPVQVPILTLIHKSIIAVKADISPVAVEGLVRIVTHVFYHASIIYDALSLDMVRPVLGVAASIMYGIVGSPHCKDWIRIFKHRMIVHSIVSVAHVGLEKGEAPEVVQDCLGSLIRLSRTPEMAEVLRSASLTSELYMPLAQYSSPDILDEKWMDVYLLCCELNSGLIEIDKFYFLEESLNFWTIHGNFVIMKLFSFTDLINHCYLQTPDLNFQTLKQLLSFTVVVLRAMSVMVPYFQQWRLQQHQTLLKLMEGVYATLETSVSLLSQPNHLLLVITKPTKSYSGTAAFKLTPQLLDIQTKMWEVVSMGVHLYMKIGKGETEFVSREQILPLLFTIIGLCGRSMSKHGDKKSHPIVNVTSEVTMCLEKGLALLLSHVIGITRDYTKLGQDERTFIREMTAEINSICDTVRRLGLPVDDFSLSMCTRLEENVRQMLCK